MEFISLEKYSTKSKKGQSVKIQKGGKNKNLKKDISKDEAGKKVRPLTQTKVIEKKNVKNKYRENLTLKRQNKVPKKKKKKEEKAAEEKEEEEENSVEEEEVEVDSEDETEDDKEEEKNADEKAFKKKCQEIDEKKKNRLFVKLKKKIYSDGQIKELHPDIRSVIFPRKKRSRWCWAIFASEERANEALKELIKNKEIFVTKPTPYDKVNQKLKERMKTVSRKKEAGKKLQQMWT